MSFNFKLITGCMFSWKTHELIRLIERAEIANKKVICFSPSKNTRDKGKIVSRSGSSYDAYKIETSNDVLSQLINDFDLDQFDLICFDETQFFDSGIVLLVKDLIQKYDIQVIMVGLDLDFKGETFGCMGDLLTLADDVVKLSAVCVKCGSDNATRTQRIINGNPASKNDPVYLVDNKFNYEARCIKCHIVL